MTVMAAILAIVELTYEQIGTYPMILCFIPIQQEV